MKFSELKKSMEDFNSKHGIERKVNEKHKEDGTLIEMTGRVIISNKVLNKEYPLEQRTYLFTNYNKALTSSDLGYSIFAQCEYDDDVMRIEDLRDGDIESAEIVKVVE